MPDSPKPTTLTTKLPTEGVISQETKIVGPMVDAHSVSPTTTAEENLHSRGQRKINMIWETTQAAIALAVTAAIIASIFLPTTSKGSETIVNAFFLIAGFYFGRTNHEKIGGVTLGR